MGGALWRRAEFQNAMAIRAIFREPPASRRSPVKV